MGEEGTADGFGFRGGFNPEGLRDRARAAVVDWQALQSAWPSFEVHNHQVLIKWLNDLHLFLGPSGNIPQLFSHCPVICQ